ncbi:MAG: recombinase family protein, partial [Pseudomonadota bacterium]|nr:recombinase family protein [Pseudomonadota bacterium]
MTIAFIYIRFSSPKQEKGASRDRQREIGERLCFDNDWEIAEVIEDLGISAWKGDHLKVGHLGRFAERVRIGEIPFGSVL